MDDPAQVVGSRLTSEIRPEHIHHLLAVYAVTRRESENFHQVCGLAQPPRTLL
jgi:hypothetical protein